MDTMKPSDSQIQIIHATSRANPTYSQSVFLAGSTAKTDTADWRIAVSDSLADLPLTVFNPFRADWGRDWTDLACRPYREQIEWELDMQERADVVLVYLHPVTDAPVSMLELGLCVRSGKAVVCVPEGFRSRANVLLVCAKFEVEVVEGIEGFRGAVLRKLGMED
ncbi:uncharacterized protein BCR38DRAFT_440519 [Pseudomassariella vexata]|uniref:Nucleoside 2-deoxyribosyltransferase domain-containing protein n=1 Tax=Pseudomassariella vexata TaxID=1141098 RepID=A0A1Y2DQH6_9PEZI|nr:uncharacterized protein BCR38DRAFT_440519 [Pseudomassariella vexata]ORY61548.1 hypothetical protein BCR38DRAFT_440519 [Pseudomassariella vexata]